MEGFREIRKKAGYTIAKLARTLDVSESTIYRWEIGETEPRLEQFFKLKELFGEDIDTIKLQKEA